MGKFFSARVAVTLPLVAVLVFGAVGAQAAPGDLDGSFGAGGTVVTPISPGVSHELADGMALQADGKIVVVGVAVISGSNDVSLTTRYNPDGSLDASFDGDGKVTTGFGAGTSFAHGVVIQPDGRIVVAGAANSSDSGNNFDFALVRYNADGSLDTSFGSGGMVTTDFGSYDSVMDIALQPDGRIVVAGWAHSARFGVARYNADGSLDASFDGDGMVMTDIGERGAWLQALAIQPDGRIVVAGCTRDWGGNNCDDFALARYNVDGGLDTTFGSSGIVITTIGTGTGDGVGSVLIQPDGRIVAVGISDSREVTREDVALVRYHPDGSLDTSFGAGGIVVTTLSPGADGALDAVLQPNGKIVAIGLADMGAETGFDFALVRYNPNGSLDTTFDNDGIVTTDVAGANTDAAFAGALQPDGKIVAAGWVATAGGYAFGLARYGGDPITNQPPVCTAVAPNISILATPNHALQLITLNGATDPDGDALTLTITGVTQDEPVNGTGDGDTSPDAQSGPASNQVYIRAERSGKGDGRVYRIAFTVTDSKGGTCSSTSTGSGSVTISVPRSQNGSAAVDSGAVFNSFGF